jgi:hypothetical protein
MGAVLPGPAPTLEQADGPLDSPAAPNACTLDGRPRSTVGGPGSGTWRLFQFPDYSSRAAFVAHWQHDLELRLR